ncbi:hypothetical protein EDD36DRAFT_475659 [Exophiala viscosa]|uniref:1-alkyl-2-acetylglycerophosphocholine esterase n=1 Tax=Exophiala viscosa TaxID=2486360 RepID=A0AAN6DTQ3_9EURO|nr:hypothetical protein EDD36DRAFT_475659 [Exophiala viscosa]
MHSSLITILLLATGGTIAKFIIPQPNGPYGVSLIDAQVIDESRRDPYTNASARIIPFTVISPAGPAGKCNVTVQPYMPNATASFWEQVIPSPTDGWNLSISFNNTFTQAELSLCKPVPAQQNEYPVILFSPALGNSREFYHIMCMNLASQGYNVITVEEPGQVGVLTYADGDVQITDISAIESDDQTLIAAVDVRVADLDFVLTTISSPSFRASHPNIQLNTSKVAIFGHSLGGAASLASIVNNTRYLGGANLDGQVVGTPLTHTTTKPSMIFGSTGHNQSLAVLNWDTTWKNLLGWKVELGLEDSVHYSFTDLPFLLETLGLENASTKQILAPLVGTIDGKQALKSVVGVMHSFFQFVFSGGAVKGVSVVNEAKAVGQVAVLNGTNV